MGTGELGWGDSRALKELVHLPLLLKYAWATRKGFLISEICMGALVGDGAAYIKSAFTLSALLP